MKFFRSILFNLAFFSWTIMASLALLPTLFMSRPVVVAGVRVWSRGVAWLLKHVTGIVSEVRGREHLPTGPVVIACKHQSAWETIMMTCILPDPSFVLKKELVKIPFYGWCALKMGSIVIDRDAGGRAMKSLLRRARAVAAAGRPVIIFPEGTRTAPGKRLPYHPGVAALYAHVPVPLVPTALNSGLYWGRRSFLKNPGRIIVEFLPPLPEKLTRKEFLSQLEDQIEMATNALIAEAPVRKPVDKTVNKSQEVL